MRALLLVLFMAAAACSDVSHRAGAERPITFDGAQTTDRAELVAHGERLTRVLGCKGCHMPRLTGINLLDDAPQYGVLYAPNLTRAVPGYSDAQLEQILRAGVHPQRRDLWVMPSYVFQNLSDTDMKALIAYLRSLSPAGTPSPAPRLTAAAKEQIAADNLGPQAVIVARFKGRQPVDLGPQYALGRYITSVTCEECHGADLGGSRIEGIKTPNLIVAGGYTRAEFERLMTTGVPAGGRKLRLMGDVAKERFPHLTLHERDALYAYLKARADQP